MVRLTFLTYFYSCLPKFTGVDLYLLLFNHASLRMVTPVYSCLPMFIRVYLYLLMFTCLLLFTYV